MDKKNKFPLLIIISTLVILGLVLAMHVSRDLTVLYPSGWVGKQERNLIVYVSLIMLVVVIPVIWMTIFFGWKYGEGKNAKYEPEWHQNHLLEAIWWAVPCIIIIFFAILTWKSSHELDPFKPLKSDVKPIHIQVVALQWKWLFIYPEEGIASVNFFQFPEKTPLHFELSADAPMNSFWLPALGGQIYAMAGMRSELNLIADHIGTFRGQSANISGTGFSGMVFHAKSSSIEEFHEWVATAKNSAKILDQATYDELARPSSYVPVEFYSLSDPALFEQILMKYMSVTQMGAKR